MEPETLAAELGMSGKRLRSWLRWMFPRTISEKGSRWYLTGQQVRAAQARFGKPGREESAQAAGNRIPAIHGPGLDIVFVGEGPLAHGRSLRTGCYYADPSNRFYAHLEQSRLTARLLRPGECSKLTMYGIGLDDVYDDRLGVRSRLKESSPSAVCFNSKRSLEAFAGSEIRGEWRGVRAGDHARIEGVRIIWAVPDSSGLASRYHPHRIDLLRDLRTAIENL